MSEPRLILKQKDPKWTYVIDEAAGTVEFICNTDDDSGAGPRTYEEFMDWFARMAHDEDRNRNYPEYQLMIRVCRDELIERGLIPEG